MVIFQKIKRLFIYILRSNILIIFWVLFFKFSVKQFSKKKGKTRKILAFNYERYTKDLIALESCSKNKNLKFFFINSRIIEIINSFYLGGKIRETLKRDIHGKVDISENNKNSLAINKQVDYLVKFLNYLKYFSKIDCFVTCSFYYFQDQTWLRASEKANFPFVVLHKECMKDESILKMMSIEYSKKFKLFTDTNIVVHNENEKECQILSEVSKPNYIYSLGCPRLDFIFKKMKNKVTHKNCVTLFSFRHSIGGLRDPSLKKFGGFCENNSIGAIKLFENTHLWFAMLAIKFPNINFFIKLKWDRNWKDYVLSVLKKKITNLNEIKNLIITSEQSSTSLIEKSKFVVGLNSTCLIEARILKKPVVVPSIFEANSSLKSRIYFKKYFDKNLYAPKNKAEFFDITSKLCKSNSKKIFNRKKIDYELFREFFGFYDGNSSKRVESFLLNKLSLNK